MNKKVLYLLLMWAWIIAATAMLFYQGEIIIGSIFSFHLIAYTIGIVQVFFLKKGDYE